MAYEICPACGSEKHQLNACKMCGYKKNGNLIHYTQVENSSECIKKTFVDIHKRKKLSKQDEIDKIWRMFAKDNLTDKNSILRNGSMFKSASPWVNGVDYPLLPTSMLSNVTVYSSWINPHNMILARDIIAKENGLKVRELIYKMLFEIKNGRTDYPYIWWLWPRSSVKRVLHEDSEGLTFVKLDNKWQMAFSIKQLGALVGAQGSQDYEDLPQNDFFVSCEYEETARSYLK